MKRLFEKAKKFKKIEVKGHVTSRASQQASVWEKKLTTNKQDVGVMKSVSHTSHDCGRGSSDFLHQKQQWNKCLAAVALIK